MDIKNEIWKSKSNKWEYTDRFIEWLSEQINNNVTIVELAKLIKIDYNTLSKIIKNNNIKIPIKSNNPKFKAVYHDYNWCYNKYMNEGLNHEEMAKEAGCSKRVIEKWCCEKHKLTQRYRQKNKALNQKQKDLIVGSMLGDGHIDKRETQPIFIVSHAENQKDYLFWKYDIIKDFCNSKPSYYDKKLIKQFKSGKFVAQPYYRISTRIHDCFIPYREKSIFELIDELNEFSFSISLLDDAHRGESNWEHCVAPYTAEEKEYFISALKNKFGIEGYLKKCDNRYMVFNSVDSKKIDDIILRNIPNELDIIQDKLINNKINKLANYKYIELASGDKIGLTAFCKRNHINPDNKNKAYQKIKELHSNGFTTEHDILNKYIEVCNE